MNWTQHINYLNAKLCKGSWVISKLKKYVNIYTLKIIYYSLIYSHLKYCITSWGKAAKTIIQPIVNTQKRVITIMTGGNCQTNSSPLFTQLKNLYHLQVYLAKMKFNSTLMKLISYLLLAIFIFWHNFKKFSFFNSYNILVL